MFQRPISSLKNTRSCENQPCASSFVIWEGWILTTSHNHDDGDGVSLRNVGVFETPDAAEKIILTSVAVGYTVFRNYSINCAQPM
jgi:hypothetical protein